MMSARLLRSSPRKTPVGSPATPSASMAVRSSEFGASDGSETDEICAKVPMSSVNTAPCPRVSLVQRHDHHGGPRSYDVLGERRSADAPLSGVSEPLRHHAVHDYGHFCGLRVVPSS